MDVHVNNRLSVWTILLAMLVWGTACVNRVIPPARPSDPTTVFLVDHGRHPSLVLPRDDGEWIRYTYGNWAWYVEDRTHFFSAFSALFWPNKAGLGRQRLAATGDMFHPAGPIEEGVVHLYRLRVSSERVRMLDDALTDLFAERKNAMIYNPVWDLEFVPHPRAYWIFHQSNKITAQWLEELGCEVRGAALFSNWRITEQPKSPPHY